VTQSGWRQLGHRIASECLAIRVRRLGRVVSRIYDTALAPYGISIAQVNLLAAIAVARGARPTDLTQVLDVEKSTLSRDLKRMEDLGWVRSDPTARPRGRSLTLTSRGGADAGAGRSSVGGGATDGVVRARKAAFRAAAEALVAVRAVVNQRRRFTSEACPASARIRAPRSKRRRLEMRMVLQEPRQLLARLSLKGGEPVTLIKRLMAYFLRRVPGSPPG